MSVNIDYIKRIVENVGRIVDHPGNSQKCQLCVQIDVISGLPVFYYSKYTEPPVENNPDVIGQRPDVIGQRPDVIVQRPDVIGQRPDVIGQRPDVIGQRPDVIVQRPDVIGQRPDVIVQRPDVIVQRPDVIVQRPDVIVQRPDVIGQRPDVAEKGIFDDITFVGGNENEESEESEDYNREIPTQLGYLPARPDDNLEILDGEERTEESNYYSYESYDSNDEESYESIPKKRNLPPNNHIVEKKQTVVVPPKPVVKQPKFVSYNDDTIYKTSNGEYVKLTGNKYLGESVEFLDKLSVKMFEKTFGPDYKEMKKYTDMQTRYENLYNAGSPA
jgi:hypothetical protein